MRPELIVRLNAKTGSLEPTIAATGVRLSPSDIAACMRQLRDYEYRLLMHIFADEAFTPRNPEWQILRQSIYSMAKSVGFKMPSQDLAKARTDRMVDVIISTEAVHIRCFSCNGIGQSGPHVCPDCNGSGLMRITENHICRHVGIKESNWKPKGWKDRYHDLRSAFFCVKGRAINKVLQNT